MLLQGLKAPTTCAKHSHETITVAQYNSALFTNAPGAGLSLRRGHVPKTYGDDVSGGWSQPQLERGAADALQVIIVLFLF